MMKWIRRLFFKSPVITGLVVFLLSFGTGLYLTLKEYQLELIEEKENVENIAELIEDRIAKIISSANSAVNILAYLVRTDRLDQNFREVGRSIIDNIDIIDQIQVLDSGEIVATYPLVGNEMVIGYDILKDPYRREEAIMAIEQRELYFAGPFELKQGGKGIVGRLPLYKNGVFEGFTAIIIDWYKFQDQVLFGYQPNSEYTIDILKIDPINKDISSLLNSNFSQSGGPITELVIPSGNWIIKVQLDNSNAFISIIPNTLFRLISSILLGFLIFKLAEQPYRLSKQVEETTKELLLSNQRFELATKATSEIIWDWDMEKDYTYRSENFERLLGYSQEESFNNDKFWKSIIHPEDYNEVESNLKKALDSSAEKWSQEFRVKKSDGQYLFIVDKGLIIRNKKGKAIRMIGSTQDITARKKAETDLADQRQRLTNVIEGTGAGTWEWNVQTGETQYNETWANIIGYTLEELAPLSIQTWIDFAHPEDLEQSNQELEKCFRGETESYESECRMKHKDGRWVWVLDRGKVFSWTKDGKPLMMFGTHVDITEKKLREEEIKRTNLQLQSANEELKSFASVASHDMKEPLRMISSFLQLLEKKYENVLDEKGIQYIRFAVDGSKRLSQLIDDMMEYAQIGFDPSKLSKVDLNSVVEEVIQLKQKVIEENNAIVEVSPLPDILGIRSPIKSVFINLISNALKYQKKNVQPVVKIYSTKEGSDYRITVEDNGIGIDKEYYQKIFNIFKRLHTKDEYPGTGIGLAICKKVVSQHGGKIWLDSEPGKGSTFHFLLRAYDDQTY
ncbi:MAG TPA: diguanylate cyclase [Algoriphagus sp.]|uniref:PAS domain-containing protein n=1 Tax=unclassified Algoriphagus TaxID=2641541 RepID=UPI000C662124|nr:MULTISPECIES: PAS domain-containing protein [unclassified Algoriphagus]MAL15212.1 diguanylate cyclase [Algoriphagus sp.]QYH37839.1 PAS domain-containing protein [Algoriphagus sp. NBT04N3]HAS60217.1 diguanylate cyclase [Algoriphagus sp.]HCB46638.1 diguanylate cyclase [Algoriphagus sp.]HCD87717.1 diguanylate cyclase [Algoriphagus sp.]